MPLQRAIERQWWIKTKNVTNHRAFTIKTQ